MTDIRDEILKSIIEKRVTARIIAGDDGILAGGTDAQKAAAQLGLTIIHWLEDARPVNAGDIITTFSGTPKQVAMAEEVLMGKMAKPSGIATAAKEFVSRAGDRLKIVSGSWKKMPPVLKDTIRMAVAAGGAAVRIHDSPFIYLDKNYVRMLGGITSSLRATAHLTDMLRVVQVAGDFGAIGQEACEAAENGAGIVFIDTGRTDDASQVSVSLSEKNLRDNVRIAYAGGVRLHDIDRLKTMDIDIVDVGRAIVDAPLLDMRMVVEN